MSLFEYVKENLMGIGLVSLAEVLFIAGLLSINSGIAYLAVFWIAACLCIWGGLRFFNEHGTFRSKDNYIG